MTPDQKLLLRTIRNGFVFEATCTVVKKRKSKTNPKGSYDIWNMGLSRDPEADHNDYSAWGRSYRATLRKLCSRVKAAPPAGEMK